MMKRFLVGLVLLGVLVAIAVHAGPEKVSFDMFSLNWSMKTVYALLAAVASGVAVGVMVRP